MTMTNDYVLYYFDATNEVQTIFTDYSTAFITLIRRLCGCWIIEKLAPTLSNIIFSLL